VILVGLLPSLRSSPTQATDKFSARATDRKLFWRSGKCAKTQTISGQHGQRAKW
jgi:hypothetical protein